MALKVEGVVDGGMDAEKTLSWSCGFEAPAACARVDAPPRCITGRSQQCRPWRASLN